MHHRQTLTVKFCKSNRLNPSSQPSQPFLKSLARILSSKKRSSHRGGAAPIGLADRRVPTSTREPFQPSSKRPNPFCWFSCSCSSKQSPKNNPLQQLSLSFHAPLQPLLKVVLFFSATIKASTDVVPLFSSQDTGFNKKQASPSS